MIPGYGSYTNQDSSTTLILVRHAEKVKDGSNDPILTPEGKVRANELMYILKHVELSAIYSTPYKRTQQTVLPTANELAGRKDYDDLNDTTYDNLFFAQVHSNGQTKIIRMRFGAHTPEKK